MVRLSVSYANQAQIDAAASIRKLTVLLLGQLGALVDRCIPCCALSLCQWVDICENIASAQDLCN